MRTNHLVVGASLLIAVALATVPVASANHPDGRTFGSCVKAPPPGHDPVSCINGILETCENWETETDYDSREECLQDHV